MCCSAWPAVFNDTIVGVWEVLVEEQLRHVLFYQNKVGTNGARDRQNAFENAVQGLIYQKNVNGVALGSPQFLQAFHSIRGSQWESRGIRDEWVSDEVYHRLAGKPARSLSEVEGHPNPGNCLIIPLLGKWDSINLLNTTDTPNLLTDVRISVRMPVREVTSALAAPGSYGTGIAPRFVFLQFDIYDIVIAERALGADQVLSKIQPAKRPKINHDVFATLDRFYGCPMAFCCFRSADDGEAKPLAFSFEPLYPQTMCVYTLDGHDGNAPSVDKLVNVNHTIFVGSYLTPQEKCAKIEYKDSIPSHLQPYLLSHTMGLPVNGMFQNGDFVFATEDVRKGIFSGLRQAPPFANYTNGGVMTLTREQEYV